MVDWKELLKEANVSLAVDKAFDDKIEYLRKKKKTIREKLPLGGYNETDAGNFVTHREETYPIKMFVLQEMSKGQYIRIGYYVVSLKKLKKEKKLEIVWAQYNPSFPKKDLLLLLEKARKEKIL